MVPFGVQKCFFVVQYLVRKFDFLCLKLAIFFQWRLALWRSAIRISKPRAGGFQTPFYVFFTNLEIEVVSGVKNLKVEVELLASLHANSGTKLVKS